MKLFKHILTAMVLSLVAGNAHADTIRWKVGRVEGLIQPKGSLSVTSAQAVLSCHYCSLGTCAGGPTFETKLETKLTEVNSTTLQLTVSPGAHQSGSFFKRLHSCSYVLLVQGKDLSTGKTASGAAVLASSLKNSANPVWLDEQVSEGLSDILSEHPLQLELKSRFDGSTEIRPLDRLPYFGN